MTPSSLGPKISHIEEIAIAVQVAVKTLLTEGNARFIEQQSQYATIVAYYSNTVIIVEVRPRFDNNVPVETVAQPG